jgi:hypothetical protein
LIDSTSLPLDHPAQRAVGRLLSAARELAPAHRRLDLLGSFFRPVFSGHQALRKEVIDEPNTQRELLKKEAKRWLKTLRDGDAQAIARFRAAMGDAADNPDTLALRDSALGLRYVQLALAREYGFSGWMALRRALEDAALARRLLAERVEMILRTVTWQGDQTAAARILARWPDLGTDDPYIAIATGNVAEVRRRLQRDPDAARVKGGPLMREPLLYLAYSRLPGSETNALAVAAALLDHGADPNATFTDPWDCPFKVLTGVVGEGEGVQPPHPQAKELATLLFERGANPFDTQVLHNTAITRDDTTWLDIFWNECARGARSPNFSRRSAGMCGTSRVSE